MKNKEVARSFVAGERCRAGNAHTDGQAYYLHENPIVVKNGGKYTFYWFGYYTQTTARHMNNVLSALDAPFRVSYAEARKNQAVAFVL